MTTVLNVKSSVFGDGGASSELNDAVLAELKANLGELDVIERDVVGTPLPYYDAEFMSALGASPEGRSDSQQARVALAEQLIEEVKRADVIVVGVPMYNFGVPAQLKTWFDYLAQAGVTFQYAENGPQGLLNDRPVYITASRGGEHYGKPTDAQTDFLRAYFNFLGLKDLRFIYAEGLNMGKREASIHKAKDAIKQWEVSHA